MEQPHTEVRGCWFRVFGEGRHDYGSIDESQAYVNTMSAPELWDYARRMVLFLKVVRHWKDLCRTG